MLYTDRAHQAAQRGAYTVSNQPAVQNADAVPYAFR